MNKIALIHHDLEPMELSMMDDFNKVGISVDYFDIRNVDVNDLASYKIVINRVYASVAARDFSSVLKSEKLIGSLETMAVRCINSYKATRADYDKYYAYQLLKAANVATPETCLLRHESVENLKDDIHQFADTYGFPLIVKRNSSGRALGIFKIYNRDQVTSVAEDVLKNIKDHQYNGKWIIQNFIENVRPYDCRMTIVFGDMVHALKRTLLRLSPLDPTPWIGTVLLGSEVTPYTPGKEELELAYAAAEAMHSDINGFDIAFGKDGPVIIENNSTPRIDVNYKEYPLYPLFSKSLCQALSTELSKM